ncbi:hypothetical protein [Streptacidiphilus monticola]|uniref:hypothetical protein n=1 Tax=Streptacidiphilus monticola TaxID=2161674 RepID=UPI0036D36F38
MFLHGGPVLLVLVLLGTAAAVRSGGVLLDRLVLAGLLLCGEVLLLGLLLSVWPWGLSVPLSCSLLLTAAGLWWWAAGRRPELPLRFRPSDLLVLGTGLFTARQLLRPLRGLTDVQQLAYDAQAPDAYVHYAVLDGIQRLHGYLFLHADAARTFVKTPTETAYPQGSHFLLAWIDLVLRDGRVETDALAGFTWLFHVQLLLLALLSALVVWGARWVGGPRLRGWRTGAVCGLLAGLVTASPFVVLIRYGFYSEVLGLVVVAAAVALLVRPAFPLPEQAAVVVAAGTAIAYTYNVYLGLFGFAAVGLMLVERARIRPALRWWLPVVLLGAGLAALPTLIAVTTSLNVADQANAGGSPASTQSLLLLVALGLLVPLTLLRPALRGVPAARSGLAVVLGGGLTLLAFAAWQLSTRHSLSYYFHKDATGTVVALLVLSGGAGWLLRPAPVPRGRWGRVPGALAAVAATAIAALLALNVDWGVQTPTTTNTASAFAGLPLSGWAHGDFREPGTSLDVGGARSGRAAQADYGGRTHSRGPDLDTTAPPGAQAAESRQLREATGPVMVLDRADGWANRRDSFLAATLRHRQGDMTGVDMEIYQVDMGPEVPSPAVYRSSLWHLAAAVRAEHEPVTVLVANAELADRIRRDLPVLLHGARVTVRRLDPLVTAR